MQCIVIEEFKLRVIIAAKIDQIYLFAISDAKSRTKMGLKREEFAMCQNKGVRKE